MLCTCVRVCVCVVCVRACACVLCAFVHVCACMRVCVCVCSVRACVCTQTLTLVDSDLFVRYEVKIHPRNSQHK